MKWLICGMLTHLLLLKEMKEAGPGCRFPLLAYSAVRGRERRLLMVPLALESQPLSGQREAGSKRG